MDGDRHCKPAYHRNYLSDDFCNVPAMAPIGYGNRQSHRLLADEQTAVN